jgi:glycosyltransferase involved in cell wall biosynthesis
VIYGIEAGGLHFRPLLESSGCCPGLGKGECNDAMIRVAYDVSFAVPPPGKPAIITGVGRVIEELLKCLRVNPELDLKVVGGFGGDWNPMITSLSVEKWASTVVKPPNPSLKGYRARSKLGELASKALYRCQERVNCSRSAKKFPAIQRAQDLALAALRRFAHSRVEWGLGRDQTDVFHSTFRSPPDWLSPNVPRVITIHDVIPLRYREEYDAGTVGTLESVLASLKPERDVVAAVSQYTKDDFCSLSGFPSERVVVAPLSAGDRFRPVKDEAHLAGVRARLGLGEKPFVLSVSNPQPRKNIPLLIRSFYRALLRLPSWAGSLVLIGNVKAGWGVEVIQQEIDKQPELAKRVIRAGGVSDEALGRLYSACDAFLFPSTGEGFGLPVLEAMQCGAPVICSNSSSLPEVAGDAAVLIDPKDEVALAEAIVGILSSAAHRRELASLSIRQASRFSWKSSAEKVTQAYRMALNLGIG